MLYKLSSIIYDSIMLADSNSHERLHLYRQDALIQKRDSYPKLVSKHHRVWMVRIHHQPPMSNKLRVPRRNPQKPREPDQREPPQYKPQNAYIQQRKKQLFVSSKCFAKNHIHQENKSKVKWSRLSGYPVKEYP